MVSGVVTSDGDVVGVMLCCGHKDLDQMGGTMVQYYSNSVWGEKG